MPDSMTKMLDQLGIPEDARHFAALENRLPEGTMLPAPQGVFPRYVEPSV
jgi:methionyl-tRNA synthetase